MRVILVALLLLLGFVPNAMARERIEAFLSTVTVNAEGSLRVIEEITVNAEGGNIRRGIFRDFPTDYTYPDGTAMRVGFDLESVTRNGNPDTYSLENLSNGKRIRIGNRDVLLSPGRHTYRLIYRTTRQLGFFDAYDELYWNVTGNGWQFPISEAKVIINLPALAKIQSHRSYTGFQGATGEDALTVAATGSLYQARTTRELKPGEGFTVAVAWQKGVVAAPTPTGRLAWWLQDNIGYTLLVATILGALLYFSTIWARVGKDPPKGTIIPLFYPPEGLGPAAVRYIWKQKFDNQAFAASLVELAVNKRLKIENDDGTFSLTKLANTEKPLSPTESALYIQLPAQTLELDNANHAAINRSKAVVQGHLSSRLKGTMFEKNFGWFVVGAAISLLGLVLSGTMMPNGAGGPLIFAGIFSAIWWSVLLSIGAGVLRGFRSADGMFSLIGRLLRLLFVVPFAIGGIAVPGVVLFSGGTSPAMIAFIGLAIVLGLINVAFLKLLPAPTVVGRAVLDKIEGFRLYLTTAEEKRLDMLNPPEKTPELFERFLPYAMALDCENQWNAKFASVLAAAAAAGATAPVWYGTTHGGWGTGGFAENLSSGLATSVSSASTPPGTTSGSGAGWSGGGGSGGSGSSGGGGGGGGGGGW